MSDLQAGLVMLVVAVRRVSVLILVAVICMIVGMTVSMTMTMTMTMPMTMPMPLYRVSARQLGKLDLPPDD